MISVSATVTLQAEAISEVEKPSLEPLTAGGVGVNALAIGPNPFPVRVKLSPPDPIREEGATELIVGGAYPVVNVDPDAAEVWCPTTSFHCMPVPTPGAVVQVTRLLDGMVQLAAYS
jgi:hypothetical protein